MSYLIQQIDGTRVGLREVRSGELVIGRGTNAQIRSENPAVALDHAIIRLTEDGYVLGDRGSITGTYLNSRPVETSVLKRGDVIEIGDLKLVVQVADLSRPLFVRLEHVDADARPVFQRRKEPSDTPVAAPTAGVVTADRIDYARAYRLRRGLLTKAGAAVLLTLLAVTAVGMVTARRQLDVFSPGKLSAAHAGVRLAGGEHLFGPGSCGECHHPFAGPSDSRCQECHAKAFHQASQSMVGECSRCHAEHRGLANLAAVHESQCIDCHRDLGDVEGTGVVAAKNTITGFEVDHPELTISFPGAVDERVTADVAIQRKMDSRGLKFDHACHMTGKCAVRAASIDSPQRVPEKLDCVTCHQVDPATGGIIAIKYEESCARCHPLTFDNRFPPVPHGVTLDAVAGVIANAYAGNRDLLSKSPEEVARIFSQSSRRQFDVGSATVRNAQRTLRVRCEQCHEIEGTAVRPVSVSRKWFRGMKPFDHPAHLNESLETRCETCHGAATTSSTSADVLMPKLAECSSCHRSSGTRDASVGGCLTCHFYHFETARSGAGWTRRVELASMTGGALAGAAIVSPPPAVAEPTTPEDAESGDMLMTGTLIFLLFLAAAAALWFWMRRRSSFDAPKPRATAGQVPPRQPSPPRAPAPRPQAPAAAAPPPEPTVAINLRETAPPAEVGGTMMIEWHGSLVGVEGPYKGRKIPIDPEGFYIGRDKEMSSVVVDDPRISRRHVWIGVKNGKVVATEQGSTNGTFLNTVGSAPITEVELKAGDVLILADTVASFRYEP